MKWQILCAAGIAIAGCGQAPTTPIVDNQEQNAPTTVMDAKRTFTATYSVTSSSYSTTATVSADGRDIATLYLGVPHTCECDSGEELYAYIVNTPKYSAIKLPMGTCDRPIGVDSVFYDIVVQR